MMNIGIADEKEGINIIDAFQIFAESVLDENISYRLWAVDNTKRSYDVLILNDFKAETAVKAAVKNVRKNGVLILNGDIKYDYKLETDEPVRLITYGFSTKASITASSVTENEYKSIQFCIQREIENLKGQIIEPQEFCVNIYHKNKNIYSVLPAVTAAVLAGADLTRFADITS